MNSLIFTHGWARTISRSLSNCELLHLPRREFDLPLADAQHAAYCAALREAGVNLTILPEEPDLPDAAFVEDTVIMLDELAVLCRLNCRSREPEREKMLPVVSPLRPIFRIAPPGALEGGDVLQIEKTLFVGLSGRTNLEGVRQLEEIVRPFGYRVIRVRVDGCLHLKTGLTAPTRNLLIANPAWVDLAPFGGFEILAVPKIEPWGANTLPVNGRALVASSAPRTADLLESKDLNIHRIDISEFQKAEAGLTCLSVLYSTGRGLLVGHQP